MRKDGVMLGVNRYAVRISRKWLGLWFTSWRPAWFDGKVRYISLGLGLFAFYAGDPSNKGPWMKLERGV